MTTENLFSIPKLSVIDVIGEDAVTILHNLTTQSIKDLQTGEGAETFITDVKGKMIGHVILYRTENGLRLIGPDGQSQAIATHADRYTIREDAVPSIADEQYTALVANRSTSERILAHLADKSPTSADEKTKLTSYSFETNGHPILAYQSDWIGSGTHVFLFQPSSEDQIHDSIRKIVSVQISDEKSFHHARIAADYPWYGIDLNDTNLPQEADRDDATISFTKGCYLGQETIARLDAMGQVQKKLVKWKLEGPLPESGTVLKSNEKIVGRLTSVAPADEGGIAIGMARRSHFESGSRALIEGHQEMQRDQADSPTQHASELHHATVL